MLCGGIVCVLSTNNILLLCGYIGAYKQYNSVYISPKQNYLVLHTFPKMVVGSCCNFYKHRIRLKKCLTVILYLVKRFF